jgi:hypothetical protein
MSECRSLATALVNDLLTAMRAIENAMHEDTGSYHGLRAYLDSHGRYHGNLNEEAVILEVAHVAILEAERASSPSPAPAERETAKRVLAFLRGIDWSCSSEDWKVERLAEVIAASPSPATETKHTCQSPNYLDGPCMECAKEKGLATGIDDGPPNSTCRCGRSITCPIHSMRML